MEMASIVEKYSHKLYQKHNILPSQHRALQAITKCRTGESGQIVVKCHDCNRLELRPVSCGNRNCPKCQNHTATQWIERQQEKLLPAQYFMVTFTLPAELRKIAYKQQREIYTLFFELVVSTVKDFGANPKHFGGEIGMVAVLHTHSRTLNYHPHIHVVVPAGGVDKKRKLWIKSTKEKYLFNRKALAKVFRARMLAALPQLVKRPPKTPKKWVAHCIHVGKGFSCIKYLSKYLYRGVISEKNIITDEGGMVTFKYQDSTTKRTRCKTLKGEDFLKLVLQHALPKGFRRVRDYGFLHSNAKKLLSLIQLLLSVTLASIVKVERPTFKCSCCESAMLVVRFIRSGTDYG